MQPNTQIHASGGEGNDTIDYERGLFIADQNDGGSGSDIISFEQPTNPVLRDLSIQNIETILFSNSEDDYVKFADGNNTGTSVFVDARYGNDKIDASAESSSSYVLNGGDGWDSWSAVPVPTRCAATTSTAPTTRPRARTPSTTSSAPTTAIR